jgi:hypothetical protein
MMAQSLVPPLSYSNAFGHLAAHGPLNNERCHTSHHLEQHLSKTTSPGEFHVMIHPFMGKRGHWNSEIIFHADYSTYVHGNPIYPPKVVYQQWAHSRHYDGAENDDGSPAR